MTHISPWNLLKIIPKLKKLQWNNSMKAVLSKILKVYITLFSTRELAAIFKISHQKQISICHKRLPVQKVLQKYKMKGRKFFFGSRY